LSEFDVVAEHKAGSKIGHMDTLSRHVSAVMDDGILNKERILCEHGKDAFCKEQIPGTYSSRRKFFLDDDGVTYRRQSNDKHQLVVPKVLIHAIIKAKHDPVYTFHPGMKRTFDLISLG
jgi:hypothetical protein